MSVKLAYRRIISLVVVLQFPEKLGESWFLSSFLILQNNNFKERQCVLQDFSSQRRCQSCGGIVELLSECLSVNSVTLELSDVIYECPLSIAIGRLYNTQERSIDSY